MPQPSNITHEFPHASLTLKGLMTELQDDIADLSQSSVEVYDKIKRKLLDAWEHWPDVVGSYRASIENMPKTLKRRGFIEQSLQDIETCEKDLGSFITEIRGVSFQDFRAGLGKRLAEVDTRIKDLHVRFRNTVDQIDEALEQSVVQRFLKGERVLSARENLQWRRKMFHVGMGVFFCYFIAYSGLPKLFIDIFTWSFFAFALSLEAARLIFPKVNQWVWKTFGAIMREHEKNKISAASYYIVAMAFVYLLFPIEVSVMTVLFIAFGDPVAGIIGTCFGRTKIRPHVSLEGFLACGVTCMIISFFCAGFLFEHRLALIPLVLFSHIGGFIGAVAESSFKKLDDNLSMPLVAAPLLWVTMTVFGVI